MSNRYYFDYNATSPLSLKVIDFLRSGDFLLLHANPASLHQSGKKSKKYINEASQFLFNTFHVNPVEFDLIYHSGASEGINTFFKGIALQGLKEKKKWCFFFSHVDHAAVYNLKDSLESLGHIVEFFGVTKSGDFNLDELIKRMLEKKAAGYQLALNFTYINNETGIIWPLSLAEEIKTRTGALVHVDAVQLVGKMKDWDKLSSSLDAFTFSGHKFGSLKGQGFSFFKKHLPLTALIEGGSQQQGMRAGTENAAGIYSLKLALEELIEKFNADELKVSKDLIQEMLASAIQGRGEIVGGSNLHRNLNTIFVVFKGHKAETLSMHFDMKGIDVSTGSACSSGVIKENRILLNMGYSPDESRSAIRFSFSPLMTKEEAIQYLEKISKVLSEILK